MTQQPQPIDLDAIEARANNTTPGPWEPRPHQHAASGCRCLGCHEDPTGWTIDHANTTFCDDAVAKLSAAGKTNDFGRELDSCDEGPFLTYADAEFAARAREDVPALLAEIRRLRAELQQARGLLDDVLTVCDATESGARRWENPLPVPEWVSIVRAAADGSNYPAADKTAHDLIECDHQAEAGQLAEQVKQLRAALHGIESDAERAARKGYDLDAEDIRATARHALNPVAVSGA